MSNKTYAVFLSCLFTYSSHAQIQSGSGNIINDLGTSVTQINSRSTACLADTVDYPLAKATGFTTLDLNNVTSAQAGAQYYDAPQAITIYGLEFYAYKTDLTGGASLNATVSVYLAGTDSMPTGTALATTTVTVDTTFGNGTLSVLRKDASFTTPVTVTAPYVLVVANYSPNNMTMVFNDYVNGDGNNEWLGSADLLGTWTRSYNLTVGANTLNGDALFLPYVTYDLTADFTFSPCFTGGSVSFTNNSSPILENRMYNTTAFLNATGASLTYDFGDGSPTVNAVNPSHTYGSTGPFQVSLTDTLFGWRSSCTHDTTKSIVESVLSPAFSMTATGLMIDFTDLTTSTDQLLFWLWDFGDGNTSVQQNPSHTYAAPGTYTICLTVTSSCFSDSTCAITTITCPPPNTGFEYTANNLSVSFMDTTSGSATWLWDFGDGNTSTVQNPNYSYAVPGTYTVCLTTTNACGADSTCRIITVCDSLAADFISNAVFLTYSFTDSSSGDVLSWHWDFGDGDTSNLQNPVHTYSTPGAYQVCLTVQDACGSHTFCDTIEIFSNVDEVLSGKVKLYPNPVIDLLTITIPNGYNTSAIEVLDVTGKQVYFKTQVLFGTSNLPLEFLPSGSYALRLFFENGSEVVKRFNVQR